MNSHFCRVGNITPNLDKTLKNNKLKKERLNSTGLTDYNPIKTSSRRKH